MDDVETKAEVFRESEYKHILYMYKTNHIFDTIRASGYSITIDQGADGYVCFLLYKDTYRIGRFRSLDHIMEYINLIAVHEVDKQELGVKDH